MSTMLIQGECNLVRVHGKINALKKVIGVLIKANFEVEAMCMHELKELVDLKFKVISLDSLTTNEKKMVAQINLISTQSQVQVVECTLENENNKFKFLKLNVDFILSTQQVVSELENSTSSQNFVG